MVCLDREAYTEAQNAFQNKSMEVLKDTLESFAPKIALHLASALDGAEVSPKLIVVFTHFASIPTSGSQQHDSSSLCVAYRLHSLQRRKSYTVYSVVYTVYSVV